MLDKLLALILAGSPTKCPSPGLLISHRQAGRVRLGWVAWAGVRLLIVPILRDAPDSGPPAASLGPAEVRGGGGGATLGVTWLDWELLWPWPLLPWENSLTGWLIIPFLLCKPGPNSSKFLGGGAGKVPGSGQV